MPRSYAFKLSYLRTAYRCDHQFAMRVGEICHRDPLGPFNRVITNFTLRWEWDGVNVTVHTVVPVPGYVNQDGDTVVHAESFLLSDLLTYHIGAHTPSEHQVYIDAEVVLSRRQCRALNLPTEYAVMSY